MSDLALHNYSCNESQNFRVGQVPSPPVYILASTSALMALIFILGLIGNVIVMIVVGCSRNMRSIVNTYLLNLCVADLLVLMICMPAALTELYTRDVWIYGEFLCK
ncbi:hypothetical protein FSP39_023554 [Pinctada imbricata]|uniref:G-protein coupled receptors family 1 profile domain-containing protein n=1 Tax=Pinctada imbricata TaxID=66713 RepID=A0AA88XK62_PINIB|nr:hypothetical protein FSP39_023554 [Pinctada imbricata]